MLKYVIAGLCGISLAGSVYMAGWSGPQHSGECVDCDAGMASMHSAKKATSAVALTGIDMKNTKCVVTGENAEGGTNVVAYEGKLYHICCDDCIGVFNKDPEKFVKALNADPAKFGVVKQ